MIIDAAKISNCVWVIQININGGASASDKIKMGRGPHRSTRRPIGSDVTAHVIELTDDMMPSCKVLKPYSRLRRPYKRPKPMPHANISIATAIKNQRIS